MEPVPKRGSALDVREGRTGLHPGEFVREGVVFMVESVGDQGKRKIIRVNVAAKTDAAGERVLKAAECRQVTLCPRPPYLAPIEEYRDDEGLESSNIDEGKATDESSQYEVCEAASFEESVPDMDVRPEIGGEPDAKIADGIGGWKGGSVHGVIGSRAV